MAADVDPAAPPEGVAGSPVVSKPAVPAAADVKARPALIRFFLSAFLSWYGDWLTTVALVVVLFELTHNPAAPAGYILVRVAPRALGPWLGGSLADRLSPRLIMIVASATQAVSTASLISFNSAGRLWGIYGAVAIAQFAGSVARPSQGAILPRLVTEQALPRANAIYWLLFGSSIFAAPALGALLLTHTGPNPLFVIDAATFVVSGALVATLPSGRAHRQAAGPIGSSKLGTVAGLRLAFRSPVIRGVAAANFASGAAVTVTQAFLVVGAHEHFGGDAAVGYLYAGVGLGSTIGGLLALRATPPRHWTHAAVFLVIVASLVALAAFSASSALAPALIFLALSAATGSSFDIWGATEVQRRAPPGYMGRFNSVIWVAQYSGMLLGALWALGTSTFLHWDLAVQIACDAMLVLVTVVWLTGPREAQPVPVAAESVALPDPQSRVSA